MRNLLEENLIKSQLINPWVALQHPPLTSSGFSSSAQVPLPFPELAQPPASGSTHSEGGLGRPLNLSSCQVDNSEYMGSEAGTKGRKQRGRGALTYTAHSSFSLRIDQ